MSNRLHSTGYILTKWVGFISAIWVQAIAGNNYGFSNYSVALKSVGNYNQLQLNNLGVAKDVGKALGVIGGLASDFLPPWLILLIGSLGGLVGYGVQWLVLSRRIAPLPYWQMCVVLCMGGNSTTWMNTAVLVTSIRNFRNNRGPVVGILKGYIGLSTAIFTVLCTSLFSNNPAIFVLLLATIPFAVCITAMIFLRPVPPANTKPERDQERKSLFLLNTMATVLAVYLLFYDFFKFPGKAAATILGLLLLAPLYLPIRMLLLNLWMNPTNSSSSKFSEDENSATQSLLQSDEEQGQQEQEDQAPDQAVAERIEVEIQEESAELGTQHRKLNKLNSQASCSSSSNNLALPDLGEDHNVLQLVRRLEFWLLFVALLCGMGTGTVVINNLGQIGETLGYRDVGTFVSLTSVWGFFGRIGSGLVSEHFLRSSGFPRPAWLAASQVLMIAGFLMLISGIPGALYIGSSITGLCYGVRLAVTVPTASELFGLKYFGLIYNILIINIPLGSFLFSGMLAGLLYDYEAQKTTGLNTSVRPPALRNVPQMWDGSLFSASSNLGTQACVGNHCYRLTYIIMIGVCIAGLAVDTMLTITTRPLYRKLRQSIASKKDEASS